MSNDEQVQQIKEADYDWLQEQEDGSYIVKTKIGNFVLNEQIETVIESCNKIATKTKTNEQSLLVVRSNDHTKMELKEPWKSKIGEALTDKNFGEILGSVTAKLKFAVAKLHGLLDFL